MKVETQLIIREIPGILRIEAQGGIAQIYFPSGNRISLSASHLVEFRDALSVAIGYMDESASVKPEPSERRQWGEGDPEPSEDVTKLVDKDGDTWHRTDKGWTISGSPWETVRIYAPLKAVVDDA